MLLIHAEVCSVFDICSSHSSQHWPVKDYVLRYVFVLYIIPLAAWEPLQKQLDTEDLSVVPVMQNLVDVIWEDQPSPPQNVCVVQPVQYAGKVHSGQIVNKIINKICTICR